MSKFHIKKVSEIDKNKLLKFYQESFSYKNNNPDILNWRYRSGFKSFEPLVLEVDAQICGHAGLIANDLKINDKIKTACRGDCHIDSNSDSDGDRERHNILTLTLTLNDDKKYMLWQKRQRQRQRQRR